MPTINSNTSFSVCATLVFLLILSSCDTANPDPDRPDIELTAEQESIVKSDNTLGFRLLQTIHSAEPTENVFISPLSISMALGMTLNGAKAETHSEMVDVLDKQGLSEEVINSSYKTLQSILTTIDSEVAVNIANSIWYRSGFDVEQPFIDVNRTYFGAEVQALDFDDESAPDVINNWVEEKTEGLINSIVQAISPQTVMYLINAMYFKGSWTYQFDPELTFSAPFYNLSSDETTVQMMSLKETFGYASFDELQLVNIPYGDSLYSMMIVLPNNPEDLTEIVSNLNSSTWDSYIASLEYKTIDFFLPRFKLQYKRSLRDDLKLLGMEKAFDINQADFSGINQTQRLFISQVLHKTVIDVTEEGTEAAAVTSVVIGTESVGPEDRTPVVRVDKPFLFVIRESTTGANLFVGKITHLE